MRTSARKSCIELHLCTLDSAMARAWVAHFGSQPSTHVRAAATKLSETDPGIGQSATSVFGRMIRFSCLIRGMSVVLTASRSLKHKRTTWHTVPLSRDSRMMSKEYALVTVRIRNGAELPKPIEAGLQRPRS